MNITLNEERLLDLFDDDEDTLDAYAIELERRVASATRRRVIVRTKYGEPDDIPEADRETVRSIMNRLESSTNWRPRR